jgi:hypothetical protein
MNYIRKIKCCNRNILHNFEFEFNFDSSLSELREYSYQRLHNLPTIMTVIPLIGIFSLFLYIIHNHILTSNSYYIMFLVGCYMVYTFYFVLDKYLTNLSASYQLITDDDNKYYVLSNLIKSALLFTYVPLASYVIYNAIVYDFWNDSLIKNAATLYAVPDTVSLFMVKKNAWSTIFHHIVVFLLYIGVTLSDFSNQTVSIGKLVVVYSVFSVFSYMVNFLLASRYIYIPQRSKQILSQISFYVYSGCCLVNWSWQVKYLYGLVLLTGIWWGIVLYVLLLCVLINDDIMLLKWIHYKCSKPTPPPSQVPDNNLKLE